MLVRGEPPETVVVEDLSLGGALLNGERSYQVGQELLLLVRLPDGVTVMAWACVVRHGWREGILGVQFHGLLDHRLARFVERGLEREWMLAVDDLGG